MTVFLHGNVAGICVTVMSDLAPLAKAAGIELGFTDVWGNYHETSDEVLSYLLNTLGFRTETAEERVLAKEKLEEQNATLFPVVKVLDEQRRYWLAAPEAIKWKLRGEDGNIREGDVSRDAIALPPLPMGYYTLDITLPDRLHTSQVIVTPEKCWQPERVVSGQRDWGLSVQLYTLRTENNWGIGDFGDLRQLASSTVDKGVALIGINPVHALFPSNPHHYAPYTPSSRFFLNSLYIDVTAVDGFDTAEISALYLDSVFQEKLKKVRDVELVDYVGVAELKYKVLRPLFERFKKLSDRQDFDAFCVSHGEGLKQHAIFDGLCRHFRKHNNRYLNWHEWPEPFKNPQSAEVKAFAVGNADEVEFYTWLQWVADAQLGKAQAVARKAGMDIGLYRDLAVGADMMGAETWAHRSQFMQDVTVGAPPDEYNPNGQNWGLPPLHPYKLRTNGYQTFINLLRANMRHCRALRIDHAFGLARLFMIPAGKSATEGAYVEYPFDEMLAVLKLESHCNQCMIIGEDLGTFPPGYEEKAHRAGILSYKVLYFEREHDGRFKAPENYYAQSLATVSTHDLPTFAGWKKNADINERAVLGLYPTEELLGKDRATRDRDIDYLRQAIEQQKFSTAGQDILRDDNAQLYLAHSPCALVTVQLEDILGMETQINLPTTVDQRPNWQRKLPRSLADILADQEYLSLAQSMTLERQRSLIDYPRATYRLQFHKDFTFYDAAAIVPYLAKLGVSHIYASPYLKARPGSTHGYDIIDHNQLNPELGGEEGYRIFCQALKQNSLKQILDFVPNHMGVGGCDNEWWLSVLEWGENSPYAHYFDIDWQPRYPGASPRLLVPFLGDHYGDVLKRGELKLEFNANEGSFSVLYFTHCFRICPRDYNSIYPPVGVIKDVAGGEAAKQSLAKNTAQYDAIRQKVADINNDKQKLHALLERQNYRVAFWRTAASDINYRRFFDINDLAGVRPEEPDMFCAMHRFILSLVRQDKIQGLRIDHVDGLADPLGYCRTLREKAGADVYLTVEKIICPGEHMRQDWAICGTSGYDALNLINALFVDTSAAQDMERIYRQFSGMWQPYDDMVYEAKLLILETTLASELQALSSRLRRIAERDRYARDYPQDTLKQALKEIIGRFSVYRTYITSHHVSESDARIVIKAVGKAKAHSWIADTTIYDFIARTILLEDEPCHPEIYDFVRKLQQLSGPVMAKGVEDTTFYRFNRLVSLNEVGGNPQQFGLTIIAFHDANIRRTKEWPHSMLATATHDTKRGEDMRMRLNVLSEVTEEWEKHLATWRVINKVHHETDDDVVMPSPNDEYFIYQILLGSWPIELLENIDAAQLNSYLERIKEYLVKAIREGKLLSNWANPNEAYEAAAHKFVEGILRSTPFLQGFMPFVRRIAYAGMINSLSQITLKLTMPGCA